MPKKPPKLPQRLRSGVTKRLELEYEQAIRKAVSHILPPKGSTPDLQAWIDHILSKENSPYVQKLTDALAGRMVRWVEIDNARTWREAAARSQKSRMLYRLLQREMAGPVGQRVRELVAENARLIRSIPLDAAQTTAHEIMRLQQMGARPKTIERALRVKFPQHTAAKIRLIARTETMKASAALTETRATHLGIRWYMWRTSEDQRVRKSHAHMDGVLIPYSQPPAPEKLVGIKSTLGAYHAGEAPNDRCVQLPLLDPDDVSWPHKVYWNGRISIMTRAQFVRLGV